MNIASLQKKLSSIENRALTALQQRLHFEFLQGSEKVEYMGEEFVVFPGVFPPRPDSIALVQNMIIKPRDIVLDVCCGSGVIGILALKWHRASYVFGCDMNEQAVNCAKENAKRHKVSLNYDARTSDVLSTIQAAQQFNVVTFNPPYRNLPVRRAVESTTWDDQMEVHKTFFSQIDRYLAPNGRVFFAQANFGDLDQVENILSMYGWEAELLGQHPLPQNNDFLFYAFEAIKRK